MDMGKYMYTIRSCHRLSQWTCAASGIKSMLCGAYIIWDEIRRKLIRVGKACSDTGSFGARMAGHMDALKSSRCDSDFYTCYPRKGYVNPTYASRARGFF